MTQRPGKLTIGVVGCGHWGPNHVRVFSELDRAEVVACADIDGKRLERISDRFPGVRTTKSYRALLRDRSVDAIVVATPTATHATIVRDALRAGKHVLVEKPLCTTSAEARELVQLEHQTGQVLMVGHVFLFNNGINRLRDTILSGELGPIYYLDAVRTNLGPVRSDVNVLYDLGTHDISIFNYLLGSVPIAVSAQGRCVWQESIEDVCFATLTYPGGTLGHIHASWMNPRKVRTLTVIGERRMAHWDDVDPTDTLRVYDKGLAEPPNYDSFGEFHCVIRNADVYLPRIDKGEPLVNQANAFVDAVLNGSAVRSDGAGAADVVSVLEAITSSMEQGGRTCPVVSPLVEKSASFEKEGLILAKATESSGVRARPVPVGQSKDIVFRAHQT